MSWIKCILKNTFIRHIYWWFFIGIRAIATEENCLLLRLGLGLVLGLGVIFLRGNCPRTFFITFYSVCR